MKNLVIAAGLIGSMVIAAGMQFAVYFPALKPLFDVLGG